MSRWVLPTTENSWICRLLWYMGQYRTCLGFQFKGSGGRIGGDISPLCRFGLKGSATRASPRMPVCFSSIPFRSHPVRLLTLRNTRPKMKQFTSPFNSRVGLAASHQGPIYWTPGISNARGKSWRHVQTIRYRGDQRKSPGMGWRGAR